MDQKIKSALKKSVKIAGVTCLALGSAALIASGAALKALVEGAEYIKDSAKKIINEKETAEGINAEVPPVEEVVPQPEEVETVIVETE